MSRTFEILELLDQDRHLFEIPPVARPAPPRERRIESSSGRLDPAEFNRQQVLRLVQLVFLAGLAKEGCGPRQVVFCGVDSADGSSSLALHVGKSLAEQARARVCVVDAAFRTPARDNSYSPPGSDKLAAPDCNPLERALAENLWVFSVRSLFTASGGATTVESLQMSLKHLRTEFDFVIISAPPIATRSEAMLFGQMSDGVVLVLEAGVTRREVARKAKAVLETSNIRILGIALNNRTLPIPQKIYEKL